MTSQGIHDIDICPQVYGDTQKLLQGTQSLHLRFEVSIRCQGGSCGFVELTGTLKRPLVDSGGIGFRNGSRRWLKSQRVMIYKLWE